jgi:conjugative relaxase-like TrwC/TraI family protein
MMTINPAASIDYSLATSTDADGLPLTDGASGTGKIGYYQSKHDADPLARPGRWFGRMADAFGLRSGDPVEARTFANLYFGRTPDGRDTLTEDMPGIREQREANRRKREAEAELTAAGEALSEARVAARQRGRKASDIDRDPGVLLARERLDRAKRERKAASGDPGTRQPAHDLAFGAPKDVSLLLMALHAEGRAGEARAIEEAFARSVERTLETIEREFLLDRPRDGDGHRTVQGISGCAGALFLHFDARPVDGVIDPHLHAHALIFSPVATLDGGVRAVWTKYLSDHQHVLGAMQRALFANALRELDYEIEPDVQKNVASFRLQGLDDRQRSAFSKRSMQVEEAQRSGLTGRKAKLKNRAAKFDRLSGQDLIDLTAVRLREQGLNADTISSPQLETRLRRKIVQRMHRERAEEIRGGSTRVKAPGTPAWDAAVERRLADELHRIREPIPATPEAILDSCLQMEAWFSQRDLERKVWEAAAHADIRPREGETREAATLRAAVASFVSDDGGSGKRPEAPKPDDIAAFHKSRIMIASTNARVARLNELAREELKSAGLLGERDWLVAATRGRCLRVAVGERLIFKEKAGHGDAKIGDGGRQSVVKSAMGTVTAVTMRRGEPVLALALDDGRNVEVDSRHFGGLDHAYALTVHKSQGMSVDRVDFVGAAFNNAELMLVALSRFRERLRVHVAEHEVEAVRNACARVTERLEANDLHAVDLGGAGTEDNLALKAGARSSVAAREALGERVLALPSASRSERAQMARSTSCSQLQSGTAIHMVFAIQQPGAGKA